MDKNGMFRNEMTARPSPEEQDALTEGSPSSDNGLAARHCNNALGTETLPWSRLPLRRDWSYPHDIAWYLPPTSGPPPHLRPEPLHGTFMMARNSVYWMPSGGQQPRCYLLLQIRATYKM